MRASCGSSCCRMPRAGVDSRTLGYSLPCAAFGIDLTIFVERCEGVAYQTPVSFKKVLAYAIAHELGHVLLRSSEHSETGIMRAHWDRATWLQAAIRGIAFDEGQARRIRSELSRMESGERDGRRQERSKLLP